ncbi:MAG: hypothetical protein HY814_03325 [Candidatus Riflebacteria bacterium]|nr:hypothetical protein [Candidatus Riflebacteria bacterium]
MLSRCHCLTFVTALILCASLLSGCGGGGGGGGPTGSASLSTPAVVTGAALLGPIMEAEVEFFEVEAGHRGNRLASTHTGTDGRFSTPLGVTTSGSVWVDVHVSRYRDEATQQVVSLPSERIVTYCIPDVAPGTTVVAPLTTFNHMATRLALAEGGLSSARMRTILASLSTASGLDVSHEMPDDLSTDDGVRGAFRNAGGAAADDGARHGLYLAGMSRRAAELSTTALEYQERLALDFEDGLLDGLDRNHALIPGLTALEMDNLRTSVRAFVEDFTRRHTEVEVEIEVEIETHLNDTVAYVEIHGGRPSVDPSVIRQMEVDDHGRNRGNDSGNGADDPPGDDHGGLTGGNGADDPPGDDHGGLTGGNGADDPPGDDHGGLTGGNGADDPPGDDNGGLTGGNGADDPPGDDNGGLTGGGTGADDPPGDDNGGLTGGGADNPPTDDSGGVTGGGHGH